MTFVPHKFETIFHGLPTIKITEEALTDMWYITSIVDMEVGWWCLTRELGDNVFLIDEVMLPKQECHQTTTEITPEGECELIMALNAKDQAESVDICGPQARVQRMRAWFHSHANMGTTPSGQDLAQVEFWRGRANLPWFIRGIVNKAGRVQVAFYDFRAALTGVYIEDVPWEVHAAAKTEVEDPRKTKWREEAKAKVSRLGVTMPAATHTPPYTSPDGFGKNYHYGDYHRFFGDEARRYAYGDLGPRGGVPRRHGGP